MFGVHKTSYVMGWCLL